MSLLLEDLVWHTERGDEAGDMRMRRGRIVELGRSLAGRRRERRLDLQGHRAFPGLINAHDHLSLNLLPHLGDPPYESLYRFAEEIHHPERSPIRETQRVAAADRLEWGGYKNLISGATSVVHHDPWPRRLVWRSGFPVRVPRGLGWSHSLRYGDDPAAAYGRCRGRPFVIHAAEGVDEESHGEVDRLKELGLLGSNTVLVHGIALTDAQRNRLAEVAASLVWCPVSNLRLYGRTAPIGRLPGVRIALGTDSTLTGSPTLLDEMRAARETDLANADEILEMVTRTAAAVFRLDGCGWIGEGASADLVVIADSGAGAAETLIAARPSDLVLVTIAGRPRLAHPELAEALGLGSANARIEGEPRWLAGDIGALKRRIEAAAGHDVLEKNPLWSMLDGI